MYSRLVNVTDDVDFCIVKNATSILEDFRCYFTMSKADDLS